MDNCIVLTGGGTAGHVTLNISLQDELKKYFKKIVYIASKTGIENELVKSRTNYSIFQIDAVKFERKKILKNFSIPFKLSAAIKEAKKILINEKPSVVFSKGGYVGLPVVIAASKLKIPVVCHESDLTMGLANKLAKRYANIICTNFEDTAKKNGSKCTHTGMPIKISPLGKSEAKQKLKINTTKPVLLVTGGSLGSVAINNFIFENINELTKKYFVLHLTGKGNMNKNLTQKDYMQIEFSNDMQTIFKASDFAISRAGANTIFELLSNKILTVFVPLPAGASRGDQIENAKYLENLNLSNSIYQNDLDLKKVQNALDFLKNNAQNIKNNIKNANFSDGTKKIMSIILENKNS